MPKKNKKLLLEKNSYQQFIEELEWQETNGMTQLKINTAIEQLNLLNIEGVEKDNLSHLQLKLLKGYFELYFKKINQEKASNVAIESILVNTQAEKDLKTMLSKAYACCSKMAPSTRQENEIRLQKARERRLESHYPDESIVIDDVLDKYAVFINIKIAISSLDDKKTGIPTVKRLFLLFNQILPFYPIEIRQGFDLTKLFMVCERNQAIFFENLKHFLAKKPISTEHEFLFLEEVQRYTLCAMLMWVNHTQVLGFKLIIDTLLILAANRLENLMFTDYELDEAEIISIIPSPLNVITALIDHYQNQKANPLLLNSLQTIEKHFIELMRRNSLQNSLRQEFIFFLDKLLDFGLATTEIEERTLILEYYHTFRPLISKLFVSYAETECRLIFEKEEIPLFLEYYDTFRLLIRKLISYTETEPMLTLILNVVDKWQACIESNKADYHALDQIKLKLEREEAVINKQSLLEQQAKDQADQDRKNTNETRRWNEKKKKLDQTEVILRTQQEKRLAVTKMSALDQAQSELDHKLSLKLASSVRKISKQIELNEKAQFSIEEICKYLKIERIEKVDKDSLSALKNHAIGLGDTLSSTDRHTLLLHGLSLADNYLSRVADKISFYKKKYAPSLNLMTDRHGQRDFARADHELYQKVKNLMEPALENLMLTRDDCECLLSIFEMIAGLRGKIENKEFYRLWNLAITFRRDEHRDLYKSFLENLQQLKIYRDSKKIAFKTSVPDSYKTKPRINPAKINEKAITKALDALIVAIKKITKILAKEDENTSYLANVGLLKEDQLREEHIQATIIEDKVRKPIEYNPYEFRRSQSFHKSGITEDVLTEEVTIAHSRRMSM